MKWSFAIILSLLLPLYVKPVNAEPITAFMVSKMLQDALQGLQDSIETAGGEVKGAGNSLQKNAQNVLVDINRVLGSNMNTAFDRLDATQRKLLTDAQKLTLLIEKSTKEVASHSFNEARLSIGDADILAYNVTYSLPCRDQVPRIVYWTPQKIIFNGDEVLVTVRGNFLNNDSEIRVKLDNVDVPIMARTDNEMSFVIPGNAIKTVQTLQTVSFTISGLKKRIRRDGILNALLGCKVSVEPAQPQQIAVVVRPATIFTLDATITASESIWSPTYVAYITQPKFYRETGSGGNSDVSEQYCLKSDEIVDRYELTATNKGGRSSVGPAVLSGDRCVFVPARVVGNGKDGLGISKGGGNIGYILTIYGKRLMVSKLAEKDFHQVANSSNNIVTFSYPYDFDKGNVSWKYTVRILSSQGSKVLSDDTLTNVTPLSPTGASVDFKDGVMSISLPGEQQWNNL
ncbi:hypothetical protein [Pantoea cypripedii]|uniref:Uncharacterized protein n=1 Tax=Pantoea cypripedii TaxID=55209 RepID=A0A6B9GGX9_PANCY|nr:hypothetical protein [Pantoea cypripedii]QGY33219.1 hypothetical protein CUN67_30385 [Pantoea cypripedii]